MCTMIIVLQNQIAIYVYGAYACALLVCRNEGLRKERLKKSQLLQGNEIVSSRTATFTMTHAFCWSEIELRRQLDTVRLYTVTVYIEESE